MRATAFVFSALLFATVSLSAQEKETITYSNITEFGFMATSPRGLTFEATTVNGFALNKQHHVGLGLGMGFIYHTSPSSSSYYYNDDFLIMHTPVFVNYRYYFKPEKSFSPHINAALGGIMVRDGFGIYSALTMGFKAGKFSFSSGLSFIVLEREERIYNGWWDDWGGYYQSSDSNGKTEKKWYFPFGFTLKCGFSF
jgi:hypothetical protein